MGNCTDCLRAGTPNERSKSSLNPSQAAPKVEVSQNKDLGATGIQPSPLSKPNQGETTKLLPNSAVPQTKEKKNGSQGATPKDPLSPIVSYNSVKKEKINPTKSDPKEDIKKPEDENKEKPLLSTPEMSAKNIKLSMSNFVTKKVLGQGTFGKVMLVQERNSQKQYALKIIKKVDIEKMTLQNLFIEKDIQRRAKHPFVLNLKFCFQDPSSVYLGMEAMMGGDLFRYLQRMKTPLTLEAARFYVMEVVLALEYLHCELDVIYRDLKPENILLDEKGHIRISDFGLSKMSTEISFSLCGTAEYLAPETIESTQEFHSSL